MRESRLPNRYSLFRDLPPKACILTWPYLGGSPKRDHLRFGQNATIPQGSVRNKRNRVVKIGADAGQSAAQT